MREEEAAAAVDGDAAAPATTLPQTLPESQSEVVKWRNFGVGAKLTPQDVAWRLAWQNAWPTSSGRNAGALRVLGSGEQ